MLIPPQFALQEAIHFPESFPLDDQGSYSEELSPSSHPQSKIFGSHAAQVRVGVNPTASIALISPRHELSEFGIFRMPRADDVRNHALSHLDDSLTAWTLHASNQERTRIAFVPPETGRALLLPPSTHPIYRDILVKGTGLVERFTRGNKLRYASRGFDGMLEMSEAERDMVHTEVLERAGVRVSAGLAVTNHHVLQTYDDFTAWTGNYVRAFRVQTRISNLFELDVPTRRAAINDAIKQLNVTEELDQPLDYVSYFRFMLEACARNVAIMQAIGFTQDSFHYGQVSLAGELTDLGIGSFRRPTKAGEVNTLHPWFRYERQPILMQNIVYKTHAVKAEPAPVRLDKNSRSVTEQTTLFGALLSIDPSVKDAIEAMQPEQLFWKIYNEVYSRFDVCRFKRDVLSRVDSTFQWSPGRILEQAPENLRLAIHTRYVDMLSKLEQHFENQVATWDRRGPTALHRQVLFGTAARAYLPSRTFDFSDESIGVWDRFETTYLNETDARLNAVEDLSWKPV